MNGTMKIEVEQKETGSAISIRTELHDIGIPERVMLLNAFCEALEIDEAAIFTMLALRDEIRDSQESIRVKIDENWRDHT